MIILVYARSQQHVVKLCAEHVLAASAQKSAAVERLSRLSCPHLSVARFYVTRLCSIIDVVKTANSIEDDSWPTRCAQVLKFLPMEKAKDARNFVQALQYWLGGNRENLENLLLSTAEVTSGFLPLSRLALVLSHSLDNVAE